MTIKQLGGVFGRNPTFNDVTIEGQLTFDGDIDINSDLKVDGDLDVTGGMTVDTNVLVVDKTNNRVGIGTASPSNLLTTDSTTGDGIQLKKAGVGQLRIDCVSGIGGQYHTPGGKSHIFNTAGVEALVIDGSQNVKVSNGNLVIGTSGDGIDFSATAGTGTSELLDDYEEGTWTPAVGTSSNEVGTWDSSFDATYTKIGRTVMINLVISGTGMGFSSTTGSRQYTGLPFPPLDDGSGSYAASGLAVGGGVAVYASGSTFYLARHFGTGTASKIQISFAYKTTA